MRAVNLIPRDARVAARNVARTSSAGVYMLLGGLAAIVVLVAVWAVANKQVGDREATLKRVNAQAQAAEQRAGAGQPYVAFQRLARDRVQTVTTLSKTRFDWAHAMHEISRVVPADVWLKSLSGASGAASEAPTPTTNAAPAPTITLDGCTHSQAKVAELMARLRTIDGVRNISLQRSEKPDSEGDTSCPASKPSDPHFTIKAAFHVPGAPKDGVDESGQVTTSESASGSSLGPADVVTATTSKEG
jgi:Tfp pilus assembly protein PilN